MGRWLLLTNFIFFLFCWERAALGRACFLVGGRSSQESQVLTASSLSAPTGTARQAWGQGKHEISELCSCRTPSAQPGVSYYFSPRVIMGNVGTLVTHSNPEPACWGVVGGLVHLSKAM